MTTLEAETTISDLGKAPDLNKIVAKHLQDGILPGEMRFSRSELAAATALVLQAAQRRQPGDTGLAHDTVSDGERRFTRFALVNDDMPFLVDSIAGVFAAHGLAIDRLVHPIVPVTRDKAGRLTGTGKAGARESLIYLETPRADARTRRAVIDDLRTALAAVRAAVTDWPAMQAAMAGDADRLGDGDGAELLRWLQGDMLTQLGHVVRRRDGTLDDPLGICRPGGPELLSQADYAEAFDWLARHPDKVPLIVKSDTVSVVHRRVPLDLFIVPVIERGRIAALSVHAGIWTSAGLATPPDRVPVLRIQLAHLMRKLGFDPRGHAGKALIHALTALPHDLLIGFAPRDLERAATAMISLVDRPRAKVVLVRSALQRHLFAFVWVPRDTISSGVRHQVMAMLEAATGTPVLDWSLEVEGNSLALLRFSLDLAASGRAPKEALLDAELTSLVRGWPDAVESELRAFAPEGRAAAIALRYAEAFPQGYRSHYGPAEAAQDIMRLYGPGDSGARFHRLPGDPAEEIRVKLYRRGGTLALSDAVPALENFGFKVIEEVSTLLAAGSLGAIHDFRLVPPAGAEVLKRAATIERALAEVIDGAAEDDAFNRLIVANELSAQEAGGLRACFRYLRQTGLTFAIATAVDALEHAPVVTRAILDLFMARHDPRFSGDRAKAEAKAAAQIQTGLAGVAAINDDRMLRQFRAVIEAILRTNVFAPAGREALAFKIDSSMVPGLPRPVPWREIFVYSRRVEGIHLRAGPVARGGLRWSDRRDDYRTEVLGLMKAQRVKNAVIVPTGAKGGFYPKALPNPATDRDSWLAEGKASYQVFVRALLSLTDNIVAGKVVHPAGIVIRDAADPYFVVAADKGTATFSDTANALAEEVDFWLDDAFASGGSKGYDHKAMGITARGGWLSVQRHFLELGSDIQTDPVRVVGCGDMSGDVFGNGMLLSKSILLVAAFDHRHIFLDPAPDAAKSWAERARLFALPRSSWADYDAKLISQGGGVFPRSQKEIPLSAEVREVLGISAEKVDPDTLISAILAAPVGLLWFGGIGTYLKASAENNVQVGDPANDAVRIDGAAVRAKVVGEGANLGCTQAGRIEFALIGSGGGGGKINTDFIDNSAGVDCSDHEVNIKIALAAAKRAGRLTEPARVKLLVAMTDEVAALVLEDNRLQALALSIAEARGPRAIGAQVRLIETLEESGQLDRKTEGLADSPTLIRRAADGYGLTRPELAVLLSSAKLALQAAIEASTLPDDPGLTQDLIASFPAGMQRKFRDEIEGHQLRREIIATILANRLINRLGMINPFELAEEEGVGLAQVVSAFVAAERLFGLTAIWEGIEQAGMSEAARVLLFHRAAEALRGHMAGLIRSGGRSLAPTVVVAAVAPAVHKVTAKVDSLLTGEALAQSLRLRRELAEGGAPDREAGAVARLFDLSGVIGISQLAGETKHDPILMTRAFTRLGEALALDWAHATADRLSPSDPWERLLVAGLARDFQQMRLDFLRRDLRTKGEPVDLVEAWLAQHAPAVSRFRAMLARAQAAPAVTPAMLARIAGQARALLGQ